MGEDEFADILEKDLKKTFTAYSISSKEALIYKIFVNENGAYKPANVCPSKGDCDYRFETDILIKKGELPLVVIETKFGGFSTHDVLTYSTKALKHKEVYPYLRYGLVVGGAATITNKFFTHNLGFDFALAIQDTTNLGHFFDIIKKQIGSAELLLDVLKNKNKTKYYSSNLDIRNDLEAKSEG